MLNPRVLYAKEKLSAALDILATHPSEIKARLRAASLEIMLAPVVALPKFERVNEDVRWIQERLTRKEPNYEGQGRVDATLYRMRNGTAIEIAERIVAAEAKLSAYVRSHTSRSEPNPQCGCPSEASADREG